MSWEATLLAVAYWLTAYLALSLAIPSGWWGGDTIGVLIAAPLTFVWIGSPKAIWQNRRWSVTLSLSLALLAIIAALVFARSREEQRLQLWLCRWGPSHR